MGTCFRKSLSEDSIDRYNYTWAVSTFLILAIMSLLFFPFIPVLNGENRDTAASTPKKTPRVKASCWCPAQFEKSQVDYTNTYCGSVATRMLQGFDDYGIPFEKPNKAPVIRVPYSDNLDLDLDTNSSETSEQETNDEEKEAMPTKQRKDPELRLNELINFRTPIILFLFALFLKLPQLVRISLRESIPGCLNLDRSLESCIACQSLDPLGRQGLKEDTFLGIQVSPLMTSPG